MNITDAKGIGSRLIVKQADQVKALIESRPLIPDDLIEDGVNK